jgi:hypothetical protein
MAMVLRNSPASFQDSGLTLGFALFYFSLIPDPPQAVSSSRRPH